MSVGEPLTITLTLQNTTARTKTLLQVRDQVPPALGDIPELAIAAISPRKQYPWRYTCYPTRRGVYHWDTVILRTAAPLGLFWSQRSRSAAAHATVYPEIIPLARCPLIDQMGTAAGRRWQAAHQAKSSNDGLTRAVRPYRWGDPTRLIHWRTSARYGELRVRELEELTADNQVLIGLDISDRWTADAFEAAVSVAASLYVYCLQKQLSAVLWLPHTGILQNRYTILSALAEVMPGTPEHTHRYPAQAMIWLGPSRHPPQALPQGSIWLRWPLGETATPTGSSAVQSAITITPQQPLINQLQMATLRSSLSK